MNSILKKGVSLGTFLIMCSLGLDANAQTIRTYGDKAEAQYGSSSSGPTALPGAPAPRVSAPAKVNTPQGEAQQTGEESGEGEPDYESPVTVFRRSGGSQKELEKLDLKPEEMYRGVIPGTRDEVDHLDSVKKTTRGANQLTWIGFQPRDQSTRVFLQTVSEPVYEVSNQGSTVVLTLSNTKLSARNFSRFIDTTYFDRIVDRIESKQIDRTTVQVTVQLKKSESPRVNATSNYVYLDFTSEKMESETKQKDSDEGSSGDVQPTALDE